MIKITKQLTGLDKGVIAPDSIIDFDQSNPTGTTVVFRLTHWVSLEAMEKNESEGWLPILEIKEFSYLYVKECTQAEFDSLDKEGMFLKLNKWAQEYIDSKIGEGHTVIF